MPLVIFGYGNISRGDDACGPLLLSRIEAAAPPDVVCIEDFQLQIEHALDLDGADLALFLDAGTGTPAPFSFTEIAPQTSRSHSSHALAPEAVLAVYQKTLGHAPPPSFVLCVRGDSFNLGDGLSADCERHLAAAWEFLQGLIAQPEVVRWRSLVTR